MVVAIRCADEIMFSLPDGYEVVLGNGGTTCFWDAATFGLIEHRSQHLSFGEFSSKFATAVAQAPHLGEPESSRPRSGRPAPGCTRGHRPLRPHPQRDLDRRDDAHRAPRGCGTACRGRRSRGRGRHLRRRRSGRGRRRVRRLLLRPAEVLRLGRRTVGGAAVAGSRRAHRRHRRHRPLGPGVDGPHHRARDSRLDQTYNTPALATLYLFDDQVRWFNDNGGLEFSVGRSDRSAEILYTWADSAEFATPFVTRAQDRSHVIGTIDFDDAIDAAVVAKVLRSNGIVDTEPYRKLGRNQLRIAMFPAIDPEDIAALCACITHVVGALGR